MTLRAFLVDDEPPARVRLRQLLAEAAQHWHSAQAMEVPSHTRAVVSTRPTTYFTRYSSGSAPPSLITNVCVKRGTLWCPIASK